MTILDSYSRPAIVRLIKNSGLTTYCSLAKNMYELEKDEYFKGLEYSDQVLVCGIMYAMCKNRTYYND